jgi:hypothetical protein
MPEIYTGSSYVLATDFRYVKWVGRTKGGKAVQIELEKAFCRSNPDWAFEEKNDTTAEVEFEAAYTDENLAKDDRTEPWKMTVDGVEAGNGEIVLGVGKFYIGTSADDAQYVGLTRGGGSFVVEREFREINADGDPGLVEGRVEKETARPKLKLTALQWLTKVSNLYSCMQTVQA